MICAPPDTPTPGPPPEQVFEDYHIILACGLGTNCPGGTCHSRYDNLIPLQRIRDGFVERGGDYTYLGDGPALNSTSVYADQIVSAMNARAGSKAVFLVGHSRGATAAVWAAGAGSYANLKAVAILDSYLLDDNHDRCLSGEYRGCVTDGNRVTNTYPTFMGKSNTDDPDIRFPDVGIIELYEHLNHYRLAAAREVASKVLDFFATYTGK